MVIDANVYWLPERIFEDDSLMGHFLRDIPRGYDTVGYLKRNGNRKQVVIERPVGCPSLDYLEGDYTLAAMTEALKAAGVDKAVLKVPCAHEWMSLDMCRLFNDGMAAFDRESGGMLKGLSVIPPWGDAESLRELERCSLELGMQGVQLSAHYGALYLDDPSFQPLFERLNELQMTAYVHHTPVPVEYGSLAAYNNLRRSYGRCVDQTTAVARELFSGMFRKYPHVKVVHSMLGGGFFAYLNMMLPPVAKGEEAAKRFTNGDEELRGWMRDNIFFEISHAQPWGKAQLECAVNTLGADHILYGSSYPVRAEWTAEGHAFIRSLDIPDEDKELILWKNAERLYGLKPGEA